jgi:hypothetical protein
MLADYAMNGTQADSEENSIIQPKKKRKRWETTVKTEGSAYPSRGQNRPFMA